MAYTVEYFRRTDNAPYSAIGAGYTYEWFPALPPFASFDLAMKYGKSLLKENTNKLITGYRITDGTDKWSVS